VRRLGERLREVKVEQPYAAPNEKVTDLARPIAANDASTERVGAPSAHSCEMGDALP
jgi:hypothetical protein